MLSVMRKTHRGVYDFYAAAPAKKIMQGDRSWQTVLMISVRTLWRGTCRLQELIWLPVQVEDADKEVILLDGQFGGYIFSTKVMLAS